MSHFAKVENGVVTEIIVATQAEINTENHGDAFLWVQTSYNNSFRNNFASLGGIYDKARDAFIYAKPYPSWELVEATLQWEAPSIKPYGTAINEPYGWDEATTSWVRIT